MQKKCLLIAICIIQTLSLCAQVYEKKTIEAGHTLGEYIYYLFSSFTDANVKLKNGQSIVSKMNFNLLICSMQFISPSGDTLCIAKPDDIDSIHLNNNVFFFKTRWIEIIGGSDSVHLAISRNATYEPVKIGALGIPSHANGIQTYTSLIDATGSSNQLMMNEDLDITKETIYYLVNDSGELVTATKSNFLNLFEKNKQRIEHYLKSQKINFNKESDLKKLLAFCLIRSIG